MADSVYKDALGQAKTDLAAAIQKKARATAELDEAEKSIIQLRRTVTSLAMMCGEDIEESMGLTEAVRVIFKSYRGWLELKGVQQEIKALGVSLDDLKNPAASVLSVLNRLVASNELATTVKKIKSVGSGTDRQLLVDQRVWKAIEASEAGTTEEK